MTGVVDKFADRLAVAPKLQAQGGAQKSVAVPVLDLWSKPDPGNSLATQLLRGEPFTVYQELENGLSWGQSGWDGYVGYVLASGLGAEITAHNRVTVLRSHTYSRPDIKSRVLSEIFFMSDVGEGATDGRFLQLKSGGYVPSQHFAPLTGDFVDHAFHFLGAPYLWGGRTASGLDCSGLVQLSLLAAGIDAPRDADMQAELIEGEEISVAEVMRGDLVFWRGHVGIISGPDRLLHSNAHYMAVVEEPFSTAVARISEGEYGEITMVKRLPRIR